MCVTLTLCVFSKNFFENFFSNFSNITFKKILPKFFPKLRHWPLQWYLWFLGLVAANSRLHASLTFYVPNPNLVRFFQNFFQKFFPKFFQYFFQKFLPKFFPKLRHTASTMVSLVPGLGSRKFATQVVYLSLASLGLVAANSRLHASFTFYVRNPNLVRFFQNFFRKFFLKFLQYYFQKILPKFFPKLRHWPLQWYLWFLGLVAANSRLHASLTFYVPNPNLVRFSQNFGKNFFQNFLQNFFSNFSDIFFKNFCQNFVQNFFPKFFSENFSKIFS